MSRGAFVVLALSFCVACSERPEEVGPGTTSTAERAGAPELVPARTDSAATDRAVAQAGGALEPRTAPVPNVGDFERPFTFAVGPDTLLYVTFSFDGMIRVIDLDSGVVRTASVPAEGVDYLPAGIGWGEDGIWCTDGYNRVLVVLDSALRPLRRLPLTVPPRVGPFMLRPVAGRLRDGRLIVPTTTNVVSMVLAEDREIPAEKLARLPPQMLGEPVGRIPVLVVEPGGTITDTLVWLSTRHRAGLLFPENDENLVASAFLQPFTDHPLFAVDPTAAHLVVVDRTSPTDGQPPAYVVTRIDASGDTVATVRIPHRPIGITPAWARQALLDVGQRHVDDPDEAIRLARPAVRIPEHLPPVSAVRVGPQGWVWIGRERPPGAEEVVWDILDPQNRVVGSVTLSSELDVRAGRGLEAWATEGDWGKGFVLWHIAADS